MSTVDRDPVLEMREELSHQAQRPANAKREFLTGDYGPVKQGFTDYNFEHETMDQTDGESQKEICAQKSVLQVTVLVALAILCVFLGMQALIYWHPEFPDPQLKALVRRSETGAVVGGVVGGTVVLLIILSVCFYQMCR